MIGETRNWHRPTDLPEEIQPVIDYFEDNFIGRPVRNGRRPPKFSISMWNSYNRVKDGLPRTNNSIEGWHKALQSHIGAHHPNFWKFFRIIQREQAMMETNLEQINNGQDAPPQRKQYKDNTRNLQKVLTQNN